MLSQDFATRSAQVSEQTLPVLHHKDSTTEKTTELKDFCLRRKWESRLV
jgi:hypothetical protein